MTEIRGPDRKTDVSGIFKTADGYLINKDNNALQAYKKRKRKEQAIDKIHDEITELRSDINQIKDLLKGLVK